MLNSEKNSVFWKDEIKELLSILSNYHKNRIYWDVKGTKFFSTHFSYIKCVWLIRDGGKLSSAELEVESRRAWLALQICRQTFYFISYHNPYAKSVPITFFLVKYFSIHLSFLWYKEMISYKNPKFRLRFHLIEFSFVLESWFRYLGIIHILLKPIVHIISEAKKILCFFWVCELTRWFLRIV